MNAFASCFGVFFLPTNPPISQALPGDPGQQNVGTLCVFNTKTRTVVIAEIIFREIAMQVLFAIVLVNAFKAAFKDGEEAFNRIGVSIVADVFANAMRYGLVIGKLFTQLNVQVTLIGHQCALAAYILADNGDNLRDNCAVYMERADLAATLHQGHNGALMMVAATGFLSPVFAANIGFVGFDRFACAADGREGTGAHGFADAVGHEPRGFVGNLKGTVKLMRRHALLGRAKQISSQEPFMQRDFAILEHGANLYREVLAAFFFGATVFAGALGCVSLAHRSAVRANRTHRPTQLLQILSGGVFVGKMRGGKFRYGSGSFNAGKPYILGLVV